MYNVFGVFYGEALESADLYDYDYDDYDIGTEKFSTKGLGGRIKSGLKDFGGGVLKVLHAILEKLKELIRFFTKDQAIYLTPEADKALKDINKMNYKLFMKEMRKYMNMVEHQDSFDIQSDIEAPKLEINVDAIISSYKGANKKGMKTIGGRHISSIIKKLEQDTQEAISILTKANMDNESGISSKMQGMITSLRSATRALNAIKIQGAGVGMALSEGGSNANIGMNTRAGQIAGGGAVAAAAAAGGAAGLPGPVGTRGLPGPVGGTRGLPGPV